MAIGTFDLGADNLLTLGGTQGQQVEQYPIELDGSLSSRPDSPLPGVNPEGLGVLSTVELNQGLGVHMPTALQVCDALGSRDDGMSLFRLAPGG